MSFSIFSIVVILIFATAILIETFKGTQRGFFRALVSLSAAVFGAIASMFASPYISKVAARQIMDFTARRMSAYNNFVAGYPALDPLIEAVACCALSAVLFMVLFFIIRGIVSTLASLCLKRSFGTQEKNLEYVAEKDSFIARNDKLLGGIAGAVCGILVTMIATSPLFGFLDIAGRSADTLEAGNDKIWEQLCLDGESIDMLQKCSEDTPARIIYVCGGRAFFRAAASTELYGERIYLLDEIDEAIDTVNDFGYVYTVIKYPEMYNSGYGEHIESLCRRIQELRLCRGLLGAFMKKQFNAWLNGTDEAIIQAPNLNAAIKPTLDSIIEVCANGDESNTIDNTISLLRVYAIFLDSGIQNVDINDSERAIEFISESDLIYKLDAELASNPNMSHIRTSPIAFGFVARRIDDLRYGKTARSFNVLLTAIAEATTAVGNKFYGTDNERVTVLADGLARYISDFGLSLTPELAEDTAEELLALFEKNDKRITPQGIRQLIYEMG